MSKKIISLVLIMATLFSMGAVSLSTEAAATNITVFQQDDSRWSNHPYGYYYDDNGKRVNATIGSSGCGLLSLVNLTYYLSGYFIEPKFLADYAVNNGYRINNVGTSHALYPNFAEDYGNKYAISYVGEVYTYNDLVKHLKKGRGAICVAPNHLMAIVDYDSTAQEFLILDSAMSNSRQTTPHGYVWLTQDKITNNPKLNFTKFMIMERKCPGAIFTDMPPVGHWSHEAIDWAVKKGIVNGTSKNTFSPNSNCTRGQIVTLLWRLFGEPNPTGSKNPFYDVKSNTYYYKAVLWAVEKGYIKGMSACFFSPNSDCSRGQIVPILWRAAGSPNPTSSYNPFYDVKSNDYYYKDVLWAREKGITSGTSVHYFSPNNNCTRAQDVTFLYNYNKKYRISL